MYGRGLAFAAGTFLLLTGFAGGNGVAQSQSYDRLTRCIGSKQEVLACCERTKKPRWWWAISASCRSAISCYPVRLANGKQIEECRIRKKDGFGLPDF